MQIQKIPVFLNEQELIYILDLVTADYLKEKNLPENGKLFCYISERYLFLRKHSKNNENECS